MNGFLAANRVINLAVTDDAAVAAAMDVVGTSMELVSGVVDTIPTPFFDRVKQLHVLNCEPLGAAIYPTGQNTVATTDVMKRACVKLVHGMHTATPLAEQAAVDIGNAHADFPGAPSPTEMVHTSLELTVNVERYVAWSILTFSNPPLVSRGNCHAMAPGCR